MNQTILLTLFSFCSSVRYSSTLHIAATSISDYKVMNIQIWSGQCPPKCLCPSLPYKNGICMRLARVDWFTAKIGSVTGAYEMPAQFKPSVLYIACNQHTCVL